MIRFELPFALPTLNTMLREGRWKQARHRLALAWQVKVAIMGVIPSQPIPVARIRVERHSVGTPDPDGVFATVKPLMDVLQPASARHPAGLGVIANDSPACLTLDVVAVKAATRAEQKTIVTIEEIA